MGLSLSPALGITNPSHFPTVIHLLEGPQESTLSSPLLLLCPYLCWVP